MQNADLQDRISQLPDDILLAILDGLNVRDAARTSLLSKRWRPLPTMISHLTIDVSDFDPKSMSSFSDDELGRINATVVKATKSILACRKSNEHTISLLSMRFYLRDDDCISFGHTVGHVMATQKVEMIEFTILTEKDDNQCMTMISSSMGDVLRCSSVIVQIHSEVSQDSNLRIWDLVNQKSLMSSTLASDYTIYVCITAAQEFPLFWKLNTCNSVNLVLLIAVLE